MTRAPHTEVGEQGETSDGPSSRTAWRHPQGNEPDVVFPFSIVTVLTFVFVCICSSVHSFVLVCFGCLDDDSYKNLQLSKHSWIMLDTRKG